MLSRSLRRKVIITTRVITVGKGHHHQLKGRGDQYHFEGLLPQVGVIIGTPREIITTRVITAA